MPGTWILALPLTLWVSLKAWHQCLFHNTSCHYLPHRPVVGLRSHMHYTLYADRGEAGLPGLEPQPRYLWASWSWTGPHALRAALMCKGNKGIAHLGRLLGERCSDQCLAPRKCSHS